jgi:uncharacterized phage infection (PIP) family protein YhgE
MRGFAFWIAVFLMTAAGLTPARAQEQKQDKPPLAAAAQPAPEKHKSLQSNAPELDRDNPYTEKVKTQALALAKALNDDQSKAVSQIMTGFDTIHKIRGAEDDVRKAVDSCSRHNPDMAQKMNGRFDKWKQAIDPVLAQNEKDMDAAIKTKVAGDPGKLKEYFDLVDKYETYEDTKIEKNPAASAKACEGLLGSMDRTQDTLAGLVAKIKWPAAKAEADAPPAPEKAPQSQTEPAGSR